MRRSEGKPSIRCLGLSLLQRVVSEFFNYLGSFIVFLVFQVKEQFIFQLNGSYQDYLNVVSSLEKSLRDLSKYGSRRSVHEGEVFHATCKEDFHGNYGVERNKLVFNHW